MHQQRIKFDSYQIIDESISIDNKSQQKVLPIMWGKEVNYYARPKTGAKPKTQFTYTESPIFPKQTSSKAVVSNHIDQILACEDILNSLNNEDQRQAERHINKLTNPILREKFALFNKDYHDIKYRKNNLVFKIDSLNDMLNRLSQLQLIDPQDVKLKDDIKQLDINALKKVVRMTNEIKVIQFIIKHKGDKMKTIQFIKFVPTQSISLINDLKSLLHDDKLPTKARPKEYQYNQYECKEKDQTQQLKREIYNLKKTIKQLQGQKDKVRDLYITKLDDKKNQKHMHKLQTSNNIPYNQTGNQKSLNKNKLIQKQSRQPFQSKESTNLPNQLLAQVQMAQKIRDAIIPIQTKYSKVIQEKDEQIRQKQKKISQKIGDFIVLQNKYKKIKGQIQGILSENKHLSLQLKHIQDNEPILQAFQQKNLKLDQQLKKQKQIRSQIENKYKSIQQKMEASTTKITSLQNKQYYLGIKNNGLQVDLKNQKEQSTCMKKKIADLNRALEKLRQDKDAQIDNIIFEKTKNEKEVGKLKGQISKFQQNMIIIQQRNLILSKRIKQLQSNKDIAEVEKYNHKQQIIHKNEKIEQLSKQIRDKERQIIALKQNQNDNQVLKNELLRKNDQISSLQSKCQQLQNEYMNYRNEKQKIQILYKQIKQQQQLLERQNLRIREQAQSLSSQAQSQKQLKQKQVKRNEQLVKDISQLQQQLNQLKQSTSRQRQQMQQQLTKQKQLLSTIQRKYDSITDDIQSQQKEKQSLSIQNKELHQRNKQLQQIKDILEKNIQSLKDQLNAHKTENQQLKSTNQKLINENHEQRQQISRLYQADKQRQNTQSVSRQLNDEIGQLIRQKEDLTQLIQQNNIKIKILQNELKDNAQKIKQSRNQTQNYKKMLQQKQQQLQNNQKQSKNTIKDLENKNSKQCEHIQASEANYKAQLDKKEGQNINLTLNLQTIQEKLKDSESKCNVYEKQLQQLKNSMQNKKDISLQTENNIKDEPSEFQLLDQSSGKPEVAQDNDLNKKTEGLERQLSQSKNLLESQTMRLNSEILQLKSEKQSLQSQLKADKSAHDERQKKLNQLLEHIQNQSQQYYSALSQKQPQYNAVQANLDKVLQELKQAKEEIQEKANVQVNLLKQINKYREKESQQQDRQMQRMGQAKKYDQERKDLNDQLADIKEKHKQSQQQKGLLKEQIEKLNNQFQQQSKSITTFKQQRQNIEKEIERLKKQIQTLKNQIETVKKQAEEKDNVNFKLISQQSINKQQNQASLLQLQGKVSQYEGELVQRQSKIDQLSAFIIQKDKKIQILEVQQIQNKKIIQQNARELQELKTYNKFSELLEKIQVLTKEKKLLQSKLVDEQNQTKKLAQDIDKLNASNKNYEQTLSTVNHEFIQCRKNIEDIVSRQNQDMENAQLKIHKLTEELQLQKRKTKELDQLFQKLTEDNQRLENDLKMKQKQRQALVLKINQAGDTTQKQKMQKKIKKYQQQIDDLTHQVDLLNQTLQEITKFNQSMDAKDIDQQAKRAETQQFMEKIEKLRQSRHKEVSQKDQIIAKLSEQLSQITQQLKQKSQTLMEMQQKIKNAAAQQEKIKATVQSLTLQSSYKDSQIKILSEQKQLLKKQHLQYQSLNRQEVQRCKDRIRMLESELILRKEGDRTLDSLFQNDLLDYHQHHKKYLKEVIENRINAKILKSRLLYRYDPLSKINYHNYIDKKENIVLIVKMANGTFVAAFTQDSFEPKKISKGDGLIISLTNREVFTLVQPNKRAITYDDYFIIFGNSQIRLKSQENKLFSNFAINNGYYSSRGFKVSVLLGGANNERELQLENYEIYQLEISYM